MIKRIIVFSLIIFWGNQFCHSQQVKERGTKVVPKTPIGDNYMEYDNSWAILIGINDYRHWNDLDYAVHDVEEVKKFLIHEYGFDENNIKTYLNKEASLENIFILLEGDFVNKIKENDRLLFFWAGHGETRRYPSGSESGYLVPYDGFENGKKNAFATYLSMDKLAQFSKHCAAKHILFLVDACYSGFAAMTRGAPSMPDNIKNYYLKLTEESGRQIITAGRKGERVLESSEWGHSAFTSKLLRGLSKPFYSADNDRNGLITTRELANYLEQQVRQLTNEQQNPVYASLEGTGEFVFIRPDISEIVSIADNSEIEMGGVTFDTFRPPDNPAIPADYFKFFKNKFVMGDVAGDGDSNEKPPHEVEVSDFYFLNHEVTNAEYFEFVSATNSHFPSWMESVNPLKIKSGCDWSFRKMGEALTSANNPVVGVSWEDALAYCHWIGNKYNIDGRLPTEAEWEFVARRGGENLKFPTGAESLSNDDANLRDTGGKDRWKYTAPIGSFGRDERGICDLAGNVWEWCYDVHQGFSETTNQMSGSRTLRGGGYDGFAWHCRVSKRLVIPISNGMSNVGFRVVLIAPNDY